MRNKDITDYNKTKVDKRLMSNYGVDYDVEHELAKEYRIKYYQNAYEDRERLKRAQMVRKRRGNPSAMTGEQN